MAIKTLISHGLRHAATLIFIGGFLMDFFVLPRLDHKFTIYLGLSYLTALGLIIALREWVVARNTASEFERKAYHVLTFGVSFFSGSAMSFIFIYAVASGAFAVSWPLFAMLFAVMIANETISTHTYRFSLDIAVLFIALVFYSIFKTPSIFGYINDTVFLLSVAASVLVSTAYVWMLKRSSENAEREAPKGYALAIGIPLFVTMLYFLNVIPAVPLSLKESGIYHRVERLDNGDYMGLREKDDTFFAKYVRNTYHMTDEDDGIYFFSSVGAPAKVSAPIIHEWEFYDERKKKWITSTTVAFSMTGGRGSGYRAYSHKRNISPGIWRVTVKVDENRIIGRQRFYIEEGWNVETERVKL